MSTVSKLFAVALVVGLLASACTTSTEVIEPTTTATLPSSTVTSTIPDFSALSIDDVAGWSEDWAAFDAFKDEAAGSCESAVVALSTIAQLLMSELVETLASVRVSIDEGAPVPEILRLFNRSAAAKRSVGSAAGFLSQRSSINGAAVYARLLEGALDDLSSLVSWPTTYDAAVSTVTVESLEARLQRISESAESLEGQDLIVRQPEWEC